MPLLLSDHVPQLEPQEGTLELAPHGELDLHSAESFEEALARCERARPERLIIDMRGLSFIDSTGIRTFLQAAKRASAHQVELTLIRGPERIQRIFALCGIEKFFKIVDDPSELPRSTLTPV